MHHSGNTAGGDVFKSANHNTYSKGVHVPLPIGNPSHATKPLEATGEAAPPPTTVIP